MLISYQANIYKLFIIQAFSWFLLFMPTYVLFFQDKGFGLKEVLLLQSIFSIAIVLFEIPSGYFSDVMGRKKTMIIGTALGSLGYLTYANAEYFWHFLLAETLLGLGISFISGTDSAMIYDSLLELKKENLYKKYEGFMQSIASLSESIAAICGGFIALISLSAPFFAQSILFAIAMILAFTLKSPTTKREIKEGNPIKDLFKIIKYTVHDHKEIKGLILFSGVIGASTLTMTFFIQPYLKQVGLPLALFGITWAALNFSMVIFALFNNKFEKFFGRKKSLISLYILAVSGYFLLAYFNSLYAIAFIFIFYFIRAVSGPIIKDYVNQLIESDIRATVLSVKNLSSRIIFAIFSPFIGYLADIYSLSTAFIIAGGFFCFFGLISLLYLHKYKAL